MTQCYYSISVTPQNRMAAENRKGATVPATCTVSPVHVRRLKYHNHIKFHKIDDQNTLTDASNKYRTSTDYFKLYGSNMALQLVNLQTRSNICSYNKSILVYRNKT